MCINLLIRNAFIDRGTQLNKNIQIYNTFYILFSFYLFILVKPTIFTTTIEQLLFPLCKCKCKCS